MSNLNYGDEKISQREIFLAVPSMLIAIGILVFPRNLAENTIAADGWISILMSGFIAIMFTWLVAKIASNFPNQPFLKYASFLVTKPVAMLFTFLFVVQGTLLTAFEVRAIADVSHTYLFERTPVQVINFSYLLVVIYAVSGSRAAIFRLNALFLPIVLVTTTILLLFSIRFMEFNNVMPMFKTDIKDLGKGVFEGTLSFTGISILFFYISLVKNPIKVPKKAVLGMATVVLFYLIIFLTCIAVFGNVQTANIRFPFIELAKSVEIPGGFFERLESIFFVIWTMAIFTTTVMAFDIALFALTSIFSKVKKQTFVFILAPVVYFLTTIPNNSYEIGVMDKIVTYFSLGLSSTVLIVLWMMYIFKGGKQGGK
ncbi:GerAB/ArcD/ProY family transporter [Ornithinibacillus halophilus]|uniref:Spore germination protein n=1 Tax=Ornithinibacillus halophilus TaxID=930117 RepID=A0A1M5NHE5_9BACI|nr:endospore germination permease [Ornithinibacillus halophilus]SHG88940.1 spore germination protein [Ornithinibacillus halophilus]